MTATINIRTLKEKGYKWAIVVGRDGYIRLPIDFWLTIHKRTTLVGFSN